MESARTIFRAEAPPVFMVDRKAEPEVVKTHPLDLSRHKMVGCDMAPSF